MGNVKKKKINRFKMSFVAGSFISAVMFGILVIAAFGLTIGIFGIYITDSKLRDENEKAKKLAQMYELTGGAAGSDTDGLPDGLADDYIITDDAGAILAVHGTDTCDLENGGPIDILSIAEHAEQEIHEELNIGYDTEEVITVYPDKQFRVIVPGNNGKVTIDDRALGAYLPGGKNAGMSNGLLGSGFLKLPFWIDAPLSDGRHMVCRSYFSFHVRELKILGILAALIVVLTIVMLICLIVYICKTIRNKKRIEHLLMMDEVTGKHNWMWFVREAGREVRKGNAHYAVLDVVFVNYRNFCVCHSVSEGDKMLRRVNDVIEGRLGKKELVAHHSAAHFCVLLTYTDKESLENRIRSMIADLENISSEHKFSFWVGVDMVGSTSESGSERSACRNADIEKEYNNAGAARATITGDDSAIAFFDDAMVEEQKWIDMINENQDRALLNEEFLVFYQPKYDPRTNELKGAEALIRWKSPAYGMISPGRFIPIFEKNGFITKIDHYMLKHVARDQKAWLDSGLSCVPVSVNVSRAHFIESDLAEQIRDIVDEAGTPHELIEIELTESAFFDDKNALISTIRKLKEYGFAVSMDDFGSGYSSLNSLKEMPLDVLKLDAEFFRNDAGDDRGRIVVSEAIRLARNLNMRTVAEGIEKGEQVDFLADQGCDMIQGYVFAKPMSKDDYVEKMKSGRGTREDADA
ncbi:MAG: GGDEF domain-containing phosphodiesterase [Lachnospiraceae bacterium]|nr:GGDEF domain-containing phosphodiesterase [Lachnospiraceae bacterium]